MASLLQTAKGPALWSGRAGAGLGPAAWGLGGLTHVLCPPPGSLPVPRPVETDGQGGLPCPTPWQERCLLCSCAARSQPGMGPTVTPGQLPSHLSSTSLEARPQNRVPRKSPREVWGAQRLSSAGLRSEL